MVFYCSMGRVKVDDELYMFLERVIESAFDHDELSLAAQWVADYCRGDSEALEYFKEVCLQQHAFIIETKIITSSQEEFQRKLNQYSQIPKEKPEA